MFIADAKLAGSALQITGKGDLMADQAVAIDLDWTAKGPDHRRTGGDRRRRKRNRQDHRNPRRAAALILSPTWRRWTFGQLVVTPRETHRQRTRRG